MELSQFREEVLANLRNTHAQMVERLRDEVDQLSTDQLPVAMAVIQDKVAHLEGERASPAVQVNVQINGETKTKAEVIAKLFGNARKPGPQ